MGVVVQGDHRGHLDRAGRHEAGVLAHLAEVVDQIGITGVEADPRAGEVVALGQRVHGQDPARSLTQDRRGGARVGELGVALVGQDGDVVGPSPGRRRGQVVQLAGGVRGRVDPQAQGAVGVLGREVVELPVRDGPHAGQRRAHRVRRVAHGGVQHRVAPGVTQLEVLRDRGDEFLAAHARRHLRGRIDPAAQAPVDPDRNATVPIEGG